jgi:hypothetical protein
MKFLAALLLLATLMSCAGPAPEPVDDTEVVEPAWPVASATEAVP